MVLPPVLRYTLARRMVIIGTGLIGSPDLSTRFAFLYDHNQLGGYDLSGRVKLKVEPLPTSLSTEIFPPCSSTNFFEDVAHVAPSAMRVLSGRP